MSGIGILEKYQDAGSVTKANVKASPGRVRAIIVTNANIAARYFQIHAKASAPAAAENCDMFFMVPAGSAAAPARVEVSEAFFGSTGRPLALGVGWAISTTATAFTDSATAADHTVTILYS